MERFSADLSRIAQYDYPMKPIHPRRPFRRVALILASIILGLWVAISLGYSAKHLKPPAGSKNPAWKEYAGNPILRFGDKVPNMFWNDPSVLKEGNTYRMWLTGGDPRDPHHIVVRVFAGQSPDGLSWEINPKPVLSPSSNPKAWDSLRTETPTVVKAGDTYHLYYTGFDEAGGKTGYSSIGHATSPDGIQWEKDPANPILKGQNADRFRWSYGGVGEPGIVFNPRDRKFYLYYTGMRFSRSNPTIGQIGILLAISTDGSHFTDYADDKGERALILTRNVPNAINGAWFGYTTPSALIMKNGSFQLFCTFIVIPVGPSSARDVVLARASSTDGIHYQVADESILEAGKGDWKDQQVRSPTAVESNGKLKIWFAGETRKPYFAEGIGLAVRDLP